MFKNLVSKRLIGCSIAGGVICSIGVPLYLKSIEKSQSTPSIEKISESIVQTSVQNNEGGHQEFKELGRNIHDNYKKNQSTTPFHLPGENDLKRILDRDNNSSEDYFVEKEDGRDCEVGTQETEAYCGFLILRRGENVFKVKIGYYGNVNGQKKLGGIVLKTKDRNKFEWYSGRTSKGETCESVEGPVGSQNINKETCRNLNFSEHFNGKDKHSDNFGGNLIGVSLIKTIPS